LFVSSAFGQPTWEIPERQRSILIDGFLDDWEDVPTLELAPDQEAIRKGGSFEVGDVRMTVRALWDKDYLYLAVQWFDDVWDVEAVSRRQAVWIEPGTKRRRDRMYFYDYLKFHIRDSEYDYTLWLSPRVNEEGPHHWNRLLKGYQGMERATGAPMLGAREQDDSATLEVMLIWKELQLKGEKGGGFPLTLVVSDSDTPGRFLENKIGNLSWLGWKGQVLLVE
jgi:hypothetical protein